MATYSGTYFGESKIVMKKISAAEISSGITLRCCDSSNIAYLIVRGVNNYDLHKNSSGVVIKAETSANISSAVLYNNWPISDTNITNSTQKLLILGMHAAGSTVLSAGNNISIVGNYLFNIDKQYLTGSSIPYTVNRGGPASSFLYSNNSIYNPWSSYLGIVLS
jgi:hypothetical protein